MSNKRKKTEGAKCGPYPAKMVEFSGQHGTIKISVQNGAAAMEEIARIDPVNTAVFLRIFVPVSSF